MSQLKTIKHYREKDLCLVSIHMRKDNDFDTYDKNGYGTLTKDEKRQFRKMPYSQDKILIYSDKKKDDLKKEYENIIKSANELKKVSNNRINMYKTGGYAETAKVLLKELCPYNPEPIETYEVDFIADNGAGLRIGVPYEGQAHKYDYHSWYPYLYSSSKISFPIKKGRLSTMTKKDFEKAVDNYFSYGIYYIKVHKSGNLKIDNLFKFNDRNIDKNRRNKYTHIELNYAKKELGLKLELIEKENNCLLWSLNKEDGECTRGSQMFGAYTKYLYEMKKNKVSGSKLLLNCIWGKLIQKNKISFIHDIEKDGEWIQYKNTQVLDYTPLNKEFTKVRITKVDYKTPFETNFSRIGPFLMASVRVKMAKTIQPYIDHVKYSHTDSMVTDIKLDIKTGPEMGDLEYEGYCENANIKNKSGQDMGEFKLLKNYLN